MQTIIILDFSTGEVHIFKVDKNIEIDERYIDNKLELNPNNCQWMVIDGELNIKLH